MKFLLKAIALNVKIGLSYTLLFPMAAYAHLISITPSIPFPSTVSEHSISTATFTVTNIGSGVIVTPINQSQFPSSLSIVSSGLGAPLAPGESCTITLQLQPTSAQNVSTILKIKSQPTLDAVQVPINVSVSPIETHDVIVIGAGISGLEAATVLQQNDVDVLILEARNRIGGRIETTTIGDTHIDLGAAWLHDTENNILATLAKKIDYPLSNGRIIGIVIDNDGSPIPSTDLTKLIPNYPALNLAIASQTEAQSANPEEAVDWASNVKNKFSDGISYVYNLVYGPSLAADTNSDSSPEIILPYQNLESEAIPSTGYTNFLNQIFDINSLNINLNSIVNKINYVNDKAVIYTTNGKAYSAKYVVITVPIGVLKTNLIQFTPPLPEPKLAAIQNLGNGLLDKVYLSFHTDFWNIPSTNTIIASNTLGNPYLIFNCQEYTNQPTLLVLTMGNLADQQELLTDDEIIHNIMSQISLIFPEAPAPTETQITRWGQDPYSLGSYSYPSMNTTHDDIVNLTLPVEDKLFFAGEAMNQVQYGTADAAYTSGFNAASAILQMVNSQENRDGFASVLNY